MAVKTAFKRWVENGVQHVFDERQRRWVKCVALNGESLNSVVVNTELFRKYRFLKRIVLSLH